MGNCRSQDDGDDEGSNELPPAGVVDSEDEEEAILLSGTLLGELGVKTLLDRPEVESFSIFGRPLPRNMGKMAMAVITITMCLFGGNTYGTMLSSEGCAEFLRSISVKYGDGSWECDLPLPVSSPDSPQDASVQQYDTAVSQYVGKGGRCSGGWARSGRLSMLLDSEDEQEEAILLSGTLLGELGVKTL
eukprot:CAMPEP_0178674996 /NCGR_PEP_ID=MMETSP0698-20121128/35158_1 /TAXON_ID=265572 /ORGANISM="Extubocellulus spinifer, Strain CCMP396" /LENGTH=188 /DNA_ID=CAMNT_0020319161 /DNA_START=86 /DNA_END=650 /DNA_ORIENTATION=-